MSVYLYNPSHPDFILESMPSDYSTSVPHIKYTCVKVGIDPEEYRLTAYHSPSKSFAGIICPVDKLRGFEAANIFGDIRDLLPDNDIYDPYPCIPRPVRYQLASYTDGMVVYELLPDEVAETYHD